MRESGFDEAHALIVRPIGERFQIISGHHRAAAAAEAGLAEVPAWVREMPDDEAFMALALCNTHGELTPIERGMHALKSGMSVRAYAEKVGRAHTSVQREMQAAKVVSACTLEGTSLDAKHLSEIHAAPSWLWPALVVAAAADDWTVERVRKTVAAVKVAAQPPVGGHQDSRCGRRRRRCRRKATCAATAAGHASALMARRPLWIPAGALASRGQQRDVVDARQLGSATALFFWQQPRVIADRLQQHAQLAQPLARRRRLSQADSHDHLLAERAASAPTAPPPSSIETPITTLSMPIHPTTTDLGARSDQVNRHGLEAEKTAVFETIRGFSRPLEAGFLRGGNQRQPGAASCARA